MQTATLMCLFIMNAGFLVVTYGPNYSEVLIRLLYGREWSEGEAPAVLGAFCYYVMTLALNG